MNVKISGAAFAMASVVLLASPVSVLAQESSGKASHIGAAMARPSSADLSGQYARALQAHVVDQWMYPPSALAMGACKVHVRQLPGGEVISVDIDESCPEDVGYRRSIEAAVIKASPLPYAGFESVFSREVSMNFTPRANGE